MEVDLKKYRENARIHNLCSEYSNIWDKCKSDKQLMDMALGSKGLDYLCDTIAKGWGISPDVLCSRFKGFINGRYVASLNGYNSKLYCRYNGEIEADTTIMGVIESDVTINVPFPKLCDVYVTGKCHIDVSGEGSMVLVCYGNPEDVTVSGTCGNLKRINKKNIDMYDERRI